MILALSLSAGAPIHPLRKFMYKAGERKKDTFRRPHSSTVHHHQSYTSFKFIIHHGPQRQNHGVMESSSPSSIPTCHIILRICSFQGVVAKLLRRCCIMASEDDVRVSSAAAFSAAANTLNIDCPDCSKSWRFQHSITMGSASVKYWRICEQPLNGKSVRSTGGLSIRFRSLPTRWRKAARTKHQMR